MIKIGGPKGPPKIVTYPSYGYRRDDGDWRLNLAGIAFQTPPFTLRQRMLIRMLGRLMQVSEEDLNCDTFRNRIAPFMAEADKGLRLQVRIGESTFGLRRKTRSNGHFDSWLRLSDDLVNRAAEQQNGRRWLRYEVTTSRSASSLTRGRVQLIPSQGLSVISDIDDTIKESMVANKRQLLRNTFLKDFRSVHGMAELYQRWHQAGAELHYVSSSPWQLFQALKQLQMEHGFPEGTIHLRNFRLRDQLLKRVLIIRRRGKATAIRRMFKNFPHRRFVLVGDSGEKDPEIYRKIFRKYGGRIDGVFIRDVQERPMVEERLRKLNKKLAPGVFSVFSSADGLEESAQAIFATDKAVVGQSDGR